MRTDPKKKVEQRLKDFFCSITVKNDAFDDRRQVLKGHFTCFVPFLRPISISHFLF